MLDPFTISQETGFSQRKDAEPMQAWSTELISRLDWMRVAELARAIAADKGCELAGSCVLEDASVVFAMLEQPATAHPRRALVKTAAWNSWGATPASVRRFAAEVATARKSRGIFIAPGGFSPAARMAAQAVGIEPVDAAGLYEVLLSLPPERSDFFFTIATAGDCTRPTCPLCLQKLERSDGESGGPLREEHQVIQEEGLVAEPVECHTLSVPAGADVTFLYEVRARRIFIAGHAQGDFACQGTLIIEPGGILTGTVTARALQVQEGGELRGQFHILEGELKPFVRPARVWHWRCGNPAGKSGCARVRLNPHQE